MIWTRQVSTPAQGGISSGEAGTRNLKSSSLQDFCDSPPRARNMMVAQVPSLLSWLSISTDGKMGFLKGKAVIPSARSGPKYAA